MVAVRAAAGVLCWAAYTGIARHKLGPVFAAMQILSESRLPDGSPPGKRPPLATPLDAIPDGWVPWRGQVEEAQQCYQIGDRLAVESDATSAALFGPRRAPTLSLRQLVAEHGFAPYIYEDVAKRVNWMNEVDRCTPVADCQLGALPLSGDYSFCFRDYVNHEEVLAMMARRLTLAVALVRATRTGRLSIEDDSKQCRLAETGVLLGILPIRIDWIGRIVGAQIVWDSTSLRLGWRRFGKTFWNPKPAEKLRVDPWVLYYPPGEEKSGDIVVCHRLNCGKLVYARDKCLKQS